MISHIFYNTDIPKHLRKTGIFKACLERGLKHFAKQNIEVNVIFVDETDDVLCLWRADFSEEDNTLLYGGCAAVDILCALHRVFRADC